MKLTITKIFKSDKDKFGKMLLTKNNKPYTKLAIKTQEYGDKWISGFEGQWNYHWKVGDTVEADVEQNGQYLNLKRPDPLAELTKRVEALEKKVFAKEPEEEADETTEVDLKDIPF